MDLVLVDDHPVVRKGVKALLEENPAYRVIGEAGTGADALALIGRLQPQVALVDIMLPDMSGFQVADAVRTRHPETRIIMLTMHADEFHVDEAFRSGADGYVVKNALEQEVVDAIVAVTSGDRYVSRTLRESPTGRQTAAEDATADAYRTLTRREREIFCLIANGFQNRIIAEKLFISLRTVETHRARIMRKLRLQSPADLIHFAVRNKIIELT